jgi:hypothetical protein
VTIDLIIPTINGREASLQRCLGSFERLTDADLNEIIVRNSRTCGAGWIEGLKESKAPYVALVADDLEVVSEHWAQVCIETVELGLLPCPRVFRPNGSIESQGGDMNAFGHILARHTKDGTQVGFSTVPFCSREQIDAIGMVDTQYGCDMYVSHRGRQLGWDTVLVHGYDLVHHQEQVGRGAGMNQNDRDAMDCATVFAELERLEKAVPSLTTPRRAPS